MEKGYPYNKIINLEKIPNEIYNLSKDNLYIIPDYLITEELVSELILNRISFKSSIGGL